MIHTQLDTSGREAVLPSSVGSSSEWRRRSRWTRRHHSVRIRTETWRRRRHETSWWLTTKPGWRRSRWRRHARVVHLHTSWRTNDLLRRKTWWRWRRLLLLLLLCQGSCVLPLVWTLLISTHHVRRTTLHLHLGHPAWATRTTRHPHPHWHSLHPRRHSTHLHRWSLSKRSHSHHRRRWRSRCSR